jgi:hypothetical protein
MSRVPAGPARTLELPVGGGGELIAVTHLALVIWGTCALAMLCALLAVAFIVVREWCWNRDRGRRVIQMLQREREIGGAPVVAGPMALQLEEIRALPEVFEPLGR